MKRPLVHVIQWAVRPDRPLMARRIAQLAAGLVDGEMVRVLLPEDPQRENPPPDPDFTHSVHLENLHLAPQDVLVTNVGSSRYHFGSRLAGRKIMYVESIGNSNFTDGGFDLYISASRTARTELRSLWGIPSQIIEPFTDPFPDFPCAPGADEKPVEADLCVYLKDGDDGAEQLFLFYEPKLRARGFSYSVLRGANRGRAEFHAALQRHRGALFLQLSEGYGMCPVEAAILGVTPFGFDGNGGREFARCLPRRTLHPWPRHAAVLRDLDAFRANPAVFAIPLKLRRKLRARFGLKRFDQQWLRALRRVLR